MSCRLLAGVGFSVLATLCMRAPVLAAEETVLADRWDVTHIGGTKAGYVHGSSDRRGAYPSTNPVTASDIVATIYHALGIPADQEIRDRQDRPVLLVPDGRPIRELFV